MTRQRDQMPSIALFALALGHALVTWDPRATVVLFVGGAALAFGLEALGVALGLLRHGFRPRVAGVPVAVVLAWPGIVYVAYRLALLVAPPGAPAAALAAVLATAADGLTDARMVERGAWEYPPSPLSGVRFGGVPWWNFAAWLGLVFVTALLPGLATRVA